MRRKKKKWRLEVVELEVTVVDEVEVKWTRRVVEEIMAEEKKTGRGMGRGMAERINQKRIK
jgi:hypothetical protein